MQRSNTIRYSLIISQYQYIGEYSQYKTLREYLRVNISQVSSLVTYKDKMDLDLKQYKDKLESLIFQFTQSFSEIKTKR